ncbi:hypothetical protein A2U01_0092460, partial [Trifolium medium]|nr:hypothetical protein [Trifolium medium]
GVVVEEDIAVVEEAAVEDDMAAAEDMLLNKNRNRDGATVEITETLGHCFVLPANRTQQTEHNRDDEQDDEQCPWNGTRF